MTEVGVREEPMAGDGGFATVGRAAPQNGEMRLTACTRHRVLPSHRLKTNQQGQMANYSAHHQVCFSLFSAPPAMMEGHTIVVAMVNTACDHRGEEDL